MKPAQWLTILFLLFGMAIVSAPALQAQSEWPQFKHDAGRSGNVPDCVLKTPLGLAGALPMSDAIMASPVVAQGRVCVMDAAGLVRCFDAKTLKPLWRFQTKGGPRNCSNVATPAFAGDYLHVGTAVGAYYVLRADSGTLVRRMQFGDPIFSSPAVGNGRVYCVTLGARVYAMAYDGNLHWTWDFVKTQLKFQGDRWNGAEWAQRDRRVSWRDQFCCSKDFAIHGNTLVIPAGGPLLWLEDSGKTGVLRHLYNTPRENPTTLGLSIDARGTVYRQWHRRDNGGRVEMLRIDNNKVVTDHVHGTQTNYNLPGSLSFSSVSIRGDAVYRCRPEKGFGFVRHRQGKPPESLDGFPAIVAPVLTKHHGVYGGLDGAIYAVPLAGGKPAWSFKTAFGKAFSAPVAVAGGRIYAGCEDGYLYVLGPDGQGKLPSDNLDLTRIRSPLTAPLKGPAHTINTSFGNSANTNVNRQNIRPPFKFRWIRRFKGTVKHFSVYGGGRMYTHTAEGQLFAVEQETGRLLWRTYTPGVHVSFTSPLYHQEKLYLPQAGLEGCAIRCINAAHGKVNWEVPFTGSPSWNRQQPPIIHEGRMFYLFSSGKYSAKNWLFEHQSTFGFPADQKPLLKAWDIKTGKALWERDFSKYGAGGDDAGMCLLDGTLYYSCYFGDKKPQGVTAALDPATGDIKWLNTRHTLHAGCTISGKDGRLYLGGYNPVDGKANRIWCLNAEDGTLIWGSDPLKHAIHVVTVRDKTLFTHAQYRASTLLDMATGRMVKQFNKAYRCTRFTVSEPYLLGANLDIYDLDRDFKLISTGPAIDILLCVGAQASNGRIFYTTNGSGLQAGLWCGDEAQDPLWLDR